MKNSIIGASNASIALNNSSILIDGLISTLTPKQSVAGIKPRVFGPKWFDGDYYALKKQLREIDKQYRKENLHILSQEYYEVKKKYKQVIASKKRQELHKRWDILIEASLNKNSKLFWTLVIDALASPSNFLCCNISS